MKKRDITIGLILGFLIGILALAVFKNLEGDLKEKFGWFSLKLIYPFPVILPILIVIGLSIANFLAQKIKVIWQLAKFIVVGVLNTFIDLGILGFLMWMTGIEKGFIYGIFKFISFPTLLQIAIFGINHGHLREELR
jgi:putative flippase GtrA